MTSAERAGQTTRMTPDTQFAEQARERLLTTREAAKFLTIDIRTLERWRIEGTGPSYLRYSAHTVRYTLGDLVAWRNSMRVEIKVELKANGATH